MHKLEDFPATAKSVDGVKQHGWDEQTDSDNAAPQRPLSKSEAETLRQKSPSLSPWAVLAGQTAAGLLTAIACGAVTDRSSVGWSALYGAMAVVVPSAIFARGLLSRVTLMNPAAAVTGFFLWEMVKVGLVLAMLFAAPKLVTNLSWPAMLIGLVVTMKAIWLVLWLEAGVRRKSKEKNLVN